MTVAFPSVRLPEGRVNLSSDVLQATTSSSYHAQLQVKLGHVVWEAGSYAT